MERTAVILAVFAILAHVQLSSQQGLVSDPNAVLRASGSYDTLKIIYGNVKAFKRAFQQGAASTTCSKTSGSLCSPYGQTYEQKAAVLVATSPQSFDARSTGAMGSFSAVAQPKDQGQCNSCVAFAILAAAQSAMACALRQDASSSMSEQDFLFCKSVSPDEERSCGSSWSMRDGIQALTSLQNAKNYPVIENCLPWSPTDPNPCYYQCGDVQQQLKLGKFTYKKIESAWEMQEHIRNWGSVVTRLEIYSDFKPFFAKNPAGIYPGHGPSASKVTSHAIQVVGYGLESQPQSWLCKNSWGTGFAAGGFFRIAFGADGVGSPDDTYGIKFVTARPPSKPYNRLTKGPGGCFYYRALPTDFVSRVAYVFNSSPSQILLDNKDIIRQPDMLLTDMTILLCGISVPQQPQGRGGGNGGSSKPSPAVEEKPPPKQSPPSSPRAEQPQTRPRLQPQPPKRISNVKAGIYKGKVACEGADMDATFTVPQAPGGNDEFELEIYSRYQARSISCDYHAKVVCLPAFGSTDGCGTAKQPWGCLYKTVIKWPDTCAGFARPHPYMMVMCSSAGAFTMAGEIEGCKKFTGVVQLVGRRRQSAM